MIKERDITVRIRHDNETREIVAMGQLVMDVTHVMSEDVYLGPEYTTEYVKARILHHLYGDLELIARDLLHAFRKRDDKEVDVLMLKLMEKLKI